MVLVLGEWVISSSTPLSPVLLLWDEGEHKEVWDTHSGRRNLLCIRFWGARDCFFPSLAWCQAHGCHFYMQRHSSERRAEHNHLPRVGRRDESVKNEHNESGALGFCAKSEERNELLRRSLIEVLGHTAAAEPLWAGLVGWILGGQACHRAVSREEKVRGN